jgi:signal transduction histidine kinase
MDRAKILIVDDQEKNIKLLKGMLFSQNYQLFEACNGEEALGLVDDIHPDLILLDVMMPGINGFEVCRQLKQDDKTKTIPIVMVTALSEKEHRVKALEAGADDFLSKPVDHTELVIRIKSLLRIKSYHDELLDSYIEIAEKNDKLLELEKIKESLTHMIIHDLRNPLGALSGFIELSLLQQNLSEDQLELIQGCASSCHDLKDMVQSLLDIHKMEEGKLELKKETLHLGEVIDSTLCQFSPKANAKQVALHCHKTDSLPMISVDRDLMKRVIANLLNNAIRHTNVDGAVTITAETFPENGSVHIRVEDTGDGLAPEYHQKVFDKFEQVRLNKKGVNVGASGLGLAFCKLAVEAHDGRIWVESEGVGKGANFQFTLPIKQSHELTD